MDRQMKRGNIASELIIVSREMKNKRPEELTFNEMIDVVEKVMEEVAKYPQ
jgi:hypothetical protein